MAVASDSPSRGLKVLLAACGLAFVLLLAALTFVVFKAGESAYAAGDSDDRREVTRVSQRLLTNLYAINYQTIDADIQRIVADFTSQAKDNFVRGSAKLKENVVKSQTISRPNVRSVGVSDLDKDSADVLVAIDRTAQAAKVQPRFNAFRWKVSLTKERGKWLVSNLTQVS